MGAVVDAFRGKPAYYIQKHTQKTQCIVECKRSILDTIQFRELYMHWYFHERSFVLITQTINLCSSIIVYQQKDKTDMMLGDRYEHLYLYDDCYLAIWPTTRVYCLFTRCKMLSFTGNNNIVLLLQQIRYQRRRSILYQIRQKNVEIIYQIGRLKVSCVFYIQNKSI